MTTTGRNWAAGYYAGFFWMGVVMTVACIALVLAGNTEMFYRLERTSIPLSWVLGGVAILEFLVAEVCHHANMRARAASEPRKKPVQDLESIESWSL